MIRTRANRFPSITNFRLVLDVVFFLPGDSPRSEFYVPTFRNTLPSFLPTYTTYADRTDRVFRP
jgi:hypothetical protein